MSEIVVKANRLLNARLYGYPETLVRDLVAEVERLEADAQHWKALWQGTVEDSTKVIQERDEALREVERLEGLLAARDRYEQAIVEREMRRGL